VVGTEAFSQAWAPVSKGRTQEEVGPRTTNVVGGRVKDAPLAHRRPGYPSVGLRARRARLRFTRQGEGSASGEGSKEAEGRKDQEKYRGC
jgi:hypothetical protein